MDDLKVSNDRNTRRTEKKVDILNSGIQQFNCIGNAEGGGDIFINSNIGELDEMGWDLNRMCEVNMNESTKDESIKMNILRCVKRRNSIIKNGNSQKKEAGIDMIKERRID